MIPLELTGGTQRDEAFLAALKGTRVAVISLGRQTTAAARVAVACALWAGMAPETIGAALAENRTAPVRVAL